MVILPPLYYTTSTMDQTQSAPADPTRVYTAAILLALFSFLTTLLILSPLCWHFRNGNIGATSLVAWIAILLLTTFLNALIWPHDNIPHWFSGAGLCDVEVKIQAGAQVALPASFAAVLRGLAAVLDTDHATLMQTKAQRRRNVVLDFSFCMGAPVLQMGVHEIVHYRRYAVLGIAGCSPILSESWLTFVLYFVPPMIWTVVDVVYAGELPFRSSLSPIGARKLILDTSSPHPPPPPSLPPNLHHHPRLGANDQIPLPAPLQHLHPLDPRLHAANVLAPRLRIPPSRATLQLARDARPCGVP